MSVVQSLVVRHHRHVRMRHCKRIAAVAAAVGVVAFARWKTTCSVLLFSPSFLAPTSFFPLSLPLPLRQSSGSRRPRHCLEPVRLLFWLLARFVGALAPSVGVGRCPYGPTRRLSTMSCVCSTHHFLRTLNSFLSLLQRISLAFFFFAHGIDESVKASQVSATEEKCKK